MKMTRKKTKPRASGDEDGEGDEEGESGDEDDSGSEMEDPDDKPTMTPNGSQRIEALSTTKIPRRRRKTERRRRQRGRGRRLVRRADDTIDDEELDEYFEDDCNKT